MLGARPRVGEEAEADEAGVGHGTGCTLGGAALGVLRLLVVGSNPHR